MEFADSAPIKKLLTTELVPLFPEEGRFHLIVEEPEGCSGGITPDAVDAAHSSPDAASPRHPRVFVKTGGLRRLIAV